MFMMILKWVAFALIIMFVGWLIPGISVESFLTAMIAAVVIALINAFIKPLILFLTLPINLLTLGLFTLVINALLFMFAAYLVPGIEVDGFVSALIGSILISIFSIGLSKLDTNPQV